MMFTVDLATKSSGILIISGITPSTHNTGYIMIFFTNDVINTVIIVIPLLPSLHAVTSDYSERATLLHYDPVTLKYTRNIFYFILITERC